MKKKYLSFELKKIQRDDDDKVVRGEIHLKAKEYEIYSFNEESKEFVLESTEKITKGIKLIGTFEKNEKDNFEISFDEKSAISKEALISAIENSDLFFSIKDVSHFVKSLIITHELKKKMNKYQKKGWDKFYLCVAKREDDEEIAFNFASKPFATKESKSEFYFQKLKENNLKHKKIFPFSEIVQLNNYEKLSF